MQPRADAAIQLERMGPSSEDEEDRLEGVVGFASVSENPQAGSVHEWAVSVDESRKRVFVALGQKSVRKLESRSQSCEPVKRSTICTTAAFDID